MAGRSGRLVLVCGLPGAGKTTLSRNLAVDSGGIRLAPDEWLIDLGIDLFDEQARARVEALQWRLAKELLAVGDTVIIEWGLWTRAERDAIRVEARELGAAVELRFLVEPVEVLWERIQERQMEQRWGARPIRWDEVEGCSSVVEYPDDGELSQFDPSAA